MLGLAPRSDDWQPPIVKAVATTGEGVRTLREELDRFQAFGEKAGAKQRRQRDQWRARLLELLRQRLFENALNQLQDGVLDARVDDILTHRSDPHTVVKDLINDFASATTRTPKRKR